MEIDAIAPFTLHKQYPRQHGAQPVHVFLDCRGEGRLGAEPDAEIGSGVPAPVYYGHVLRWRIPALKGDAANALLARIAPLAARVCAGYTKHWDGNNHVGRFSADATAAEEQIRDLCDHAGSADEQIQVFTAGDYFGALGSLLVQARELGITADTTDAQLTAIGETELGRPGVDVIDGLADHLDAIRAACIADLAHLRAVA